MSGGGTEGSDHLVWEEGGMHGNYVTPYEEGNDRLYCVESIGGTESIVNFPVLVLGLG